MGNIIQDSIVYVKSNYPEVSISKYESIIVFKGRFVIRASYKDFNIDIAPKLEICLPTNYPNMLPQVRELSGKYVNEHLLDNGNLCVATEFDQITQLCNSKTIGDYFDKFLIPFFISLQFNKERGYYIFGDRKHGVDGIYQSLADYFNLYDFKNNDVLKLLQWLAKIERFRKIYPNHLHRYKVSRRFSSKIGNLRKKNIIALKVFARNLSKLDEIQKRYFAYKKVIEDHRAS